MAGTLEAKGEGIRGGSGGGNGGGSAVASALGGFGDYPKRMRNYLHDVRVEMQKVNWPTRADVWSTTIVVTVTVAFFGVYFWLADGIFSQLYIYVNNYFHHH